MVPSTRSAKTRKILGVEAESISGPKEEKPTPLLPFKVKAKPTKDNKVKVVVPRPVAPEYIGIKNGTEGNSNSAVVIVRPTNLSQALSQAHREFSVTSRQYSAELWTKLTDDYFKVTPETWPCVIPGSSNMVYFKLLENFQIFARTFAGPTIAITVTFKMTVLELREIISIREGLALDNFYLLFSGSRTSDDAVSLFDNGVGSESCIQIMGRLRGGKPVIYLFPPKSFSSIDVNLTLCPQWKFSTIHPLTKTTSDNQGSQRVKWNVSASSNGDLVDLSSGRELSYLFWEAVSHYSPPPPTLSAIDTVTNQVITAFDPSRPILNSKNSILLPFTEFIAYLDNTLKLLTLHVSARNDFITYWLPHFIAIHEKGQFISMRFSEQEHYEKAAILDVTPVPNVVTRVFMLFKGVDSDQIGWEAAKERVGTIHWKAVVGIKEDAMDVEKFRVLEWGGMEVV